MKCASIAFLILLISGGHLEAQQPLDRCQDRVAAVIANIQRPCKLKEHRKAEKETSLDPKTDVLRQLSAGQQLQCKESPKRTKKDQGCVTIFFCGSRQARSVTTISPKWFGVVNVPDYLPREDTRPGGRASVDPAKYLLPAFGAKPAPFGVVTANVFRPKNPEIDKGLPKASFMKPGGDLYLKNANRARDAGNLAEARAYYERAAALNPEDSRAILGMGNIYADQGQWQAAEEFYVQAIKSNPALGTAYAGLTYVILQRASGGGSLRLAEAESSAQEAIRIQPMNAVAHDLYGVTLEMKGSLEEAEQAYRRAIEIKPDFVTARFHLSQVLRMLGRHSEAERQYARAVSGTADPMSLLLSATTLQNDGRFRSSEAPLLQLLAKEPDNIRAMYLLSRALVYRKQYAKALPLIDRVCALDKSNFEARRLLAFAYLKMKQPESAEDALKLAAAVATPEQRKLLTASTDLQGLAELYLLLNRPKDAVRVYKTAVTLDPENQWLREAAARVE